MVASLLDIKVSKLTLINRIEDLHTARFNGGAVGSKNGRRKIQAIQIDDSQRSALAGECGNIRLGSAGIFSNFSRSALLVTM